MDRRDGGVAARAARYVRSRLRGELLAPGESELETRDRDFRKFDFLDAVDPFD